MKHELQKITTRENGTLRVQTINIEPSMTQQQFEKECDINNIIARYQKTGELTHLNQNRGAFADLSEITTYQDMVNQVMKADETFAALPAQIRKRFENNPQKLIDFLNDEKSYDEALALGLVNPRESKPETLAQTKNESKTKNEPETKKDSQS